MIKPSLRAFLICALPVALFTLTGCSAIEPSKKGSSTKHDGIGSGPTLVNLAQGEVLEANGSTLPRTLINSSYYTQNSDKARDKICAGRCVADARFPNKSGFPSLIFFHGGALTSGTKQRVKYFEDRGFAVISPTYRFYPEVSIEAILQDAAAAVAWSMREIEKRGGDMKQVALAGYSAGGYIALQLAMNPEYLARTNVAIDQFSALVTYSAHTITHMTIREQQGIAKTQPLIDLYAPLYHVRKHTPPILLITGDRELELLGRYEENAYFWRMMRVNGNDGVTLVELEGYDHDMVSPAHPVAYQFLSDLYELGGSARGE